jgi:predicted nucleotidyltransferase
MSISEKSGLDQMTIHKIRSVFLRYPQIQDVMLYGSRAKGTHKPNSDYDLAVLMTENISVNDTNKVKYEIKDDVENTTLPYLFDIQSYNDIDNTALRDHIDRVGILIFDKTLTPTNTWDESMLDQIIIDAPELAHIVYDIKHYPDVVNLKQTKEIIDALKAFVLINKL